MYRRTILIAACLLVAACAAPQRAADSGPTPNRVVIDNITGVPVHWGGEIVKVKNLRDRTLIEVLALPLQKSGQPRVDATPEGRFIVEQDGFVEPHEYAAGRLIEVRGHLEGFTNGRVGEAPYRYPVLRSERIALWPQEPASAAGGGPRVRPSIGIGIGTGSGGTRVGGGVGIGIGF